MRISGWISSGPPLSPPWQDGFSELLSAFKHLHRASYPCLPDLGVFRALEPEQDRVDVGLFKVLKVARVLLFFSSSREVCTHHLPSALGWRLNPICRLASSACV